jgi:lysophospholipase L1-like esterase
MVKTVLAYGDSNTHGTAPMRDVLDQRRYGPDERWAGHAAAELGDGFRIIEEGLPGRTTVLDDPIAGEHKNGRTMLLGILESHRPLDAVVLMLGTNDLKAQFCLSAANIAGGVERLARIIAQSETGPDSSAPRLLIVAPPPIEEIGWIGVGFAGGRARSLGLGAAMAAVAVRVGAGFLDAGAHVIVSAIDGIHYEREAHAVLGRAISSALVGMLK